MNKILLKKAKNLAKHFKAGLFPGREAQDGTTSHEKDNFVQISIAVLEDKRFGKKGIYRYNIDRQTCFTFRGNDVIIIAPYGRSFHIFYCEWDAAIEGHLPIYFLGSYKK